ncbi:exostosin family protein [Roseimicrobium sp. ORNL1]|nr:exostosin family protein [Roseimicrobium sp. ORNL1]
MDLATRLSDMTRVCLTSLFPDNPDNLWNRGSYTALLKGAGALNDTAGLQLTEQPDDADIVLFSDVGGVPGLLVPFMSAYRRCWTKALVYSDADFPPDCLRGVYASIMRTRYDANWHAGGPYIREGAATWSSVVLGAPLKLFTFAGSCETHPVRQKLLELYGESGLVLNSNRQRVTAAFSAGSTAEIAELRRVMEVSVGQGQFALCPRGVGASSMRLFEVMSMGRAPVIISDEWVPPSGPNWNDFSIRIAEAEVEHLHELLEPHRHRAHEMGVLARRAWEEWFSPDVWLKRTVEACISLQKRPGFGKRIPLMKKWAAGFGCSTELRGAVRFLKHRSRFPQSFAK